MLYHQRLLASVDGEKEEKPNLESAETSLSHNKNTAYQEPDAAIDRQFVAELKVYVDQHLDREINNTMLSQLFNLSQRQFERRLKKITGLTLAKFVKEIRLQTARKQLEEGNFQSVIEVAYFVGFSSVQRFSKSYIKRFGKKPSEYHKK